MSIIEKLVISNDRDTIETYADQGYLIRSIPGHTDIVYAIFLVPTED